jgi:hypothetical protein
MITDFSEEPTASIFIAENKDILIVTLKIKAVRFSEKFVTFLYITWRHIIEHKLQIH